MPLSVQSANVFIRGYFSRYKDIAIQASSELVSSFYSLRNLMVFFDHFHNEQYQSALRVSNFSKQKRAHVLFLLHFYFFLLYLIIQILCACV